MPPPQLSASTETFFSLEDVHINDENQVNVNLLRIQNFPHDKKITCVNAWVLMKISNVDKRKAYKVLGFYRWSLIRI